MKNTAKQLLSSLTVIGAITFGSIAQAESVNIDIPIRMGLKPAGSGFAQAKCDVQNANPESRQRDLARGSQTLPLVFEKARSVSGNASLMLEGLELGNEETLRYQYRCSVVLYRQVVEGERPSGRTFPGDNFITGGQRFPGDDFVRRNDFYQDSSGAIPIHGQGEVFLRKRPSRIPN